ncbi:TetR/AcrR family transcriptional regulator [Natrinema ejinorense]|uniref:TetR family transcriptional regulator n=1 Tax=Natrinema ejinorense TaxID=373386 RepID=A0A2A5QVR5_9EURY|nr:TetR/AcrR family transcriptional regulator [Natrinema ejinorense]PCR90927.1 TetR family transcriptional regulator [Natrinema ejinorense]
MDQGMLLFDESAGGKEAIFAATYRTLEEDGYADLSISRVADEASVSKSTIYHHFESKDELLLEFANSLLVTYADELIFETGENALESLDRLLDLAVLGETADGDRLEDYASETIDRVILELRTQAVHDPAYRDHFDSFDRMARNRLAALIEAGIEEGTVREVDPDAVAGMLYLCIEGALLLGSTTDDDGWIAGVRTQLDHYLDGLARDGVGDK